MCVCDVLRSPVSYARNEGGGICTMKPIMSDNTSNFGTDESVQASVDYGYYYNLMLKVSSIEIRIVSIFSVFRCRKLYTLLNYAIFLADCQARKNWSRKVSSMIVLFSSKFLNV